MKTEELQAIGLTEEQIKKVFELNGTDIKAEQKKTVKAETERDQWKSRAETAEETLKGFDGVDVEGLNKQIADWKEKAEQAEKDYQQKIYDRDFADALNTALGGYKFASKLTKEAVAARAKSKLTFKEGKLYGLSDLIAEIQKEDESAILPETEPPKFTQPPKGNHNGGGNKSYKEMTVDERIALKYSNPELYNKLRKGE